MTENGKTDVQNNSDERRQFPRLSYRVDVEYKLVDRGRNIEQETVTKNISAGGVCLVVYDRLEEGNVLYLKIKLADIGRMIVTKGKVVWINPFAMSSDNTVRYDMGLEFIEISEDDRQVLSNYLMKKAA